MAIADKLSYLNGTKQAIKNALIDKGVEVSDSDSFRSYADKVASIEAGGGSGSIVRAYLPAEYSGSTEKGTKLLLNTKDYYVQETAEWESEPANSQHSWENSFVGLDCASYGGYTSSSNGYIAYKDTEGQFISERNSGGIRYMPAFMPITKNAWVALNSQNKYTCLLYFGGGTAPKIKTAAYDRLVLSSARTNGFLQYCIYFAKKTEPHLVYTFNRSKSNVTTYKYNVNFKDNTFISNSINLPTKGVTLGSWSKNPDERIYFLTRDASSGEAVGYYWDSVEHGDVGLTAIEQTLPTIPAAFQYAVQFPTTLTINGEEVMYSFLNTGGDLYVYSFKESTMQWAEEPEIAQLIKDQLGTFSDNVNIQPQMDGTLYCTNDLIMCAFSFNSDGTITQVAHPCSDYVGKLENLVEFNATVNKYAGTAGLCYRLSTDPSQSSSYMFHFVYFKLEPHEDTGELEWVAYDKKRSNYAVESITGISTGVTGTTEDGRDYVECTVSLPEE